MESYYYTDLGVFAIIIAIILLRRLRPRKFKKTRVFTLPAIYLVLLLFSSLGLSSLMLISLIPAGYLGYLFGMRTLENNEIRFFYRDGKLYYQWPTSVTLMWSMLFIARISLYFLGLNFNQGYVTNLLIDYVINLLLSVNTGLLIAASRITLQKAKKLETF